MEHIRDALINGEVRQLNDAEAAGASKFHSGRLAFIWINGEIHFNKMGDTRDHQHWVLEDFGVSPEEFENMPRGYCKADRIQLFIGSGFKPIKEEHIGLFDRDFLKIAIAQKRTFHNDGMIPVYNGVIVGKVGDIWPPLGTIRVYPTEDIVIPKPLDDEIKAFDAKMDELKYQIGKLKEEQNILIHSAEYCDKCKSYYPKTEVRTLNDTEKNKECVYQDCGYGDDDEYAEVERLVTYLVCPYCGGLTRKSSIVLRTGPSKRRWE